MANGLVVRDALALVSHAVLPQYRPLFNIHIGLRRLSHKQLLPRQLHDLFCSTRRDLDVINLIHSGAAGSESIGRGALPVELFPNAISRAALK